MRRGEVQRGRQNGRLCMTITRQKFDLGFTTGQTNKRRRKAEPGESRESKLKGCSFVRNFVFIQFVLSALDTYLSLRRVVNKYCDICRAH